MWPDHTAAGSRSPAPVVESIGGTITPGVLQYVAQGGSVTFAVQPSAHHHIADVVIGAGSIGASSSVTLSDVTADETLTALFATDTVTVHYAADVHGSIVGSATQVVDYGGGAAAVTASPAAGYDFVSWSDGSTANPRTDTNVVADKAVSASFALITYTLPTTTKLAGSSSAKLKRTYRLTGTVSPAGPGKVTITMTRLVGKKYKSAGSVKSSVSGGTFACSFKPKYKGSWQFVAQYSGGVVGVTTYNPSKSATKTVKVK